MEHIATLPHYGNSCGVSAVFAALSALDFDSDDKLIKTMLYWVNGKIRHNYEFGIAMMKKFYETYNLGFDYKNSQDIIKMIASKIYSPVCFIDLSYDYEYMYNTKIKKLAFKDDPYIMLDYEVVKSIKEDVKGMSVDDEDPNSPFDRRSDVASAPLSKIKIRDHVYTPCVFITCNHYHYLTFINTENGVILFDDLDSTVRVVEKNNLENYLGQNIELVVYAKMK